ncbi:MAG: phenylalanine--tRNA ligase subunit beta [Patescibacteria group bacterium]|nr:phenylalanine--tRNA ligase subunit beta [Patescibacteria group bacterium]MDD4304058.1 phenylalanine--tRNA ligase subunit beta [Patescibacteria group bacterium]MDD4694935.1 phenylalanine--tRNA ligase subunit beta [Patescibacteria group bacterium]
MFVSKQWLKNYVDIPDNLSPQELADKITMSIVEIENIIIQGENLENIVVAQVKEINNHPNADKLKICHVDAGKRGVFKIVCGGNNLYKDMFVPLALPGSKVKWHGEGDFITLEKTKIRGVESEGMIAAAEEIGLSSNYMIEGGVADLKLTQDDLGIDLSEAMKLDDVIFEIDNKSLTNRPDLWGHYGIARELAALLDLKFKEINFDTKIKSKDEIKLKVDIENKEVCCRYMGVVVKDIEILPSPEWISKSLERVGIRSINNIVDITNFIMLELGQPLHAFDLENIEDEKIIVRNAKEGEKFVTLDNETRILTKEDLLICDSKKPIALAGVMGGQNSQITNNTKSILIESANFDASTIRKTSSRLGLRTDSSSRFEKSLDPNLANDAICRSIELIKKLSPKSYIASQLVDENFSKEKNIIINLDIEFVNKKIGEELPRKTIIEILTRLGFFVKDKKEFLEVLVPSYRAGGDVSIAEDLIEEISRIYGYDNIKPQLPSVLLEAPFRDKYIWIERTIKDIVSGNLDYNEVYNYSMISEDDIFKLKDKKDDYIEIANAVSKNLKYLRNNLLVNLCKNIYENLKNFDNFKIFEIGRIFAKSDGRFKVSKDSKEFLPKQDKNLAMAMVGNLFEFFELKKDVELLLHRLNVEYCTTPCDNIYFDKEVSLKYFVDDMEIGCVGKLDKEILKNFDIEKDVFYVEFNTTILVKSSHDMKKYQPISKYPKMIQDISMLVSYNYKWQDIENRINSISPLIEDVDLFDVYDGDKIEKGNRSLACHITFHDSTRTLVSEEVEKIMKNVREMLVKDFKVKIR